MSVDLKVPSFGESITEVAIETWLVSVGDYVALDEPVVNIESEKATLELPAPVGGYLRKISAKAGDYVAVGQVIGSIEPSAPPKTQQKAAAAEKPAPPTGPAARRILSEKGLSPKDVEGTGRGGRILKEDAQRAASTPQPTPAGAKLVGDANDTPQAGSPAVRPPSGREEELVPMSPIRKVIARRLVEASQTTAMLTTFNDVDMTAVMEMRAKFKAPFHDRYGIKLGFMGFFVKAAIEALKAFPSVNAEIREDRIAYHNYFDIGVAIGGGKGLVVPVVRSAERMSFAEIELAIGDFATRAKGNKLSMEELRGGTFTISNGGVYGSLLSTPILNIPQSGILGMHKIEKRAVVVDDQIVIRPMMYLALTYDHRIVDGREAVQFLIRIKECVEQPERILLEV